MEKPWKDMESEMESGCVQAVAITHGTVLDSL